MTQPNPPIGWYPDPTGRHESRYFDAQWTQHVSTRGVVSLDPLAAWPPPVPTTPVPTVAGTPYVPAAQGEPMMSAYLPSAPSTKRSPNVMRAIAGGVIVLAVGIILAVSLSGGGGGGHGFCADARALNKEFPSAAAISVAQLPHAASEFDKLAAESPSPQDAADLRYLARWLRSALNGGGSAVEINQAHAEAAATRFDAYATATCSSNANR